MTGNALVYRFERLLALADVEIGGTCAWDIHVHNHSLYTRVLTGGSLALGQSYMDGWWDCPRLDEFFFRILRAQLDTMVKPRTWLLDSLKAGLFNRQKPSRAYQVGEHHYDMDIHLYQHMLDDRLIYSCGFWETATTLEAAQENKLNLVCRKLQLQPGMRILDIGCGWGGTAKFIAERFDVEGVFVLEDWHSFGPDYDRTLMQWFRNFDENWDVFSASYDNRFYRMWKYYLLSCAGAFRARKNQLWQLVFSPKGLLRGYVTQHPKV